MRFANKHNVKNYLANHRIAVIQKSRHKLQSSLQFTNNRLVDKYILNYYAELSDEVYDPFTQDNIAVEVAALNRLATSKDFQRILQHSLVTRNTETEVEAARVINSVQDSLTQIEAERVVKNLDYVHNVLEQNRVDVEKYEKLIEKLPRHVSRKEVLERCIIEGEPLPPTRRQEWLERNLARGESYNKRYTYKELNQLSRDLERYKAHRFDYEKSMMENRQADREGYDVVNESKTWIWSQLENTRHQELDGETIPLTAKFEVVNSQNGATDYLLFPGDVSNDTSNCANICNCACTYEINKI